MSYQESIGGLRPPPGHPSIHTSESFSPASSSPHTPGAPPPLPPRPSGAVVSPPADENSETEEEGETLNAGDGPGAPSLTVNSLSTKDEEELSEVQLRELYDDEEIERFLHLFSTYVREVRAPSSTAPSNVARAASSSAPALSETLSGESINPSRSPARSGAPRSLSERVAVDLFLPLLPPPRPPPPEFSLGRLKQTAQRLYVALEPLYSVLFLPLLRLATWKDPRKSFSYCALYWILWYHELLFSALILLLLWALVRRKLHPYPNLDELRAFRARIDRSQTLGEALSARLMGSPSLGIKDMWALFKDYRHAQKQKKAAKAHKETGSGDHENEENAGASDAASVCSVTTEKPDEDHEVSIGDEVEKEDVRRLGLFLMNEVADLLERVKNIFLWRNPSASVFYGAVLSSWFLLGLLPATYLVRFIGFLAGAFFWHVIPVLAAIPPSERSRIPPALSSVPTDAEYAMDLISQRVARGLPVRPKRRKARRRLSDPGVVSTAEHRDYEQNGVSSSINWKKWGGRLASTKERTGELKKLFQDGQWKRSDGWRDFVDPLVPRVVTPQGGSEIRIETHTFPAQCRQHPGLITLTPTTVFFTPLLSSRATLSIPLADVTGVKKSSFVKGIDIHYTEPRADGSREEKQTSFLFVGSRDDLFARLISYSGKRWTRV
ncbi:hypothetical protein BD414DRAFT_456718 [Trametes punicea]|nr:hypothetical protein BD414DRAFT_456718 [Trametes punicea]